MPNSKVGASLTLLVSTRLKTGLRWCFALMIGLLAQQVLTAPALAQSSSGSLAALNTPGTFSEQALPQVLSAQDAKLYREIFTLQEAGQWAKADQKIAKLSDKRLLGHVLFQRYMHPTAYRSKYVELKKWLDLYADHPGADRIYKLAKKRRPANYKAPKRPVAATRSLSSSSYVGPTPYRSTKTLTRKQRKRARQIKRQVRRNVLRTRLTVTEKLLNSGEARKLLDQVERDEGFAKVAAAWYYYGKPEKAYALASAAAERSGHEVSMAPWIAGLSAWRLGRLEDAARHFEAVTRSRGASDWTASAGAYWAARARLRLRQPAEVGRLLRQAATTPRTFYGILAGRALGMEDHLRTASHRLTPKSLAKLAAQGPGARALALIQLRRFDLAQEELLRLSGWDDPDLAQGILALAERAKLARLSFKVANWLADYGHLASHDHRLTAALYPIPHWQPSSGFDVDRALVYALMRQESAFNPKAKSKDGARGLMQLMPSTASYMSERRYRGKRREELYDPGLNLELAQRYLNYLLSHGNVRGDLFRLATAYNGGPGNLGRWERTMDLAHDPLLFIESLPSRETRIFIERVLTNFWIYRARLGQQAPSLDAAASGDWPGYYAQDQRNQELAHRESN